MGAEVGTGSLHEWETGIEGGKNCARKLLMYIWINGEGRQLK